MKIDLVTLLWFLKIVLIAFIGNFASIFCRVLDVIKTYSAYNIINIDYVVILNAVLIFTCFGTVYLYFIINDIAVKIKEIAKKSKGE